MKRKAQRLSAEDRKKRQRVYSARYYRKNKEATRVFDKYFDEHGAVAFPDTILDNRLRQCMTAVELSSIEAEGIFEPVDEKKKREVYQTVQKRLNMRAFSRKVCAVCDCFCSESSAHKCYPTGATARKWVKRLSGSADVPNVSRKEYDVSTWFPELRGALLSARGVGYLQSHGKSHSILFVCTQCYNSLKSSSCYPPKFSIANGNDIGTLPIELSHANFTERRMTSMTSVATCVTVLRGGKHRAVRGHTTVITMDPSAISRTLPDLLTEGQDKFLVVMARELTPLQEIIAMRKHMARPKIVQGLLNFYVNNNFLYKDADVKIDQKALEYLTASVGAESVSSIGVTVESVESDMSDDHQLYVDTDILQSTASNDHQQPGSSSEEELCYRESVFAAVKTSGNTTLELLAAAEETLLVRNEGTLLSAFEKDLFGLAFPDQFPLGRGHFGTKRGVRISLEEHVKYLTRLSTRCFAQHPVFPAFAFDVCGRRRVMTSTAVRSKIRPKEFEAIGSVTREELATALAHRKERRRRQIAGISDQSKQDIRYQAVDRRLPAEKLLNQVTVSQSSMWGSREERLTYRRKGFSLDAYLKSGAIFVTITPNDIGTIIVSVLAGGVTPEEAESMKIGEISTRAKRVEICGKDPVACSEYFENICEAFFEDLVGFDTKNKMPFREGGIFGIPKAYFATVESQGSGTLHMHSIIYIAGLPGTARGFSERCDNVTTGPEFKTRFTKLVDSIISTSIPCTVRNDDSLHCPACNEVDSLRPVAKIARCAYRFRSSNQRPVPISHFILCKQSFGATEVIRAELQSTEKGAVAIGCEDVIPIGSNAKENDRITEAYTCAPRFPKWPENAENGSATSMQHRLRISRIALLTQQHNHCHVPSCFKSGCASQKDECRYMFPRKAGIKTKLGTDNVLQVGRKMHHEYINPYNDVILLSIFCNHDIRFLVGSGTTDAMYYCMKYLTKVSPEDSCVEKNIMSCHNRRKATEDDKKRMGTPLDARSAGRSRINSICTMLTKRQQVAITMCVLYLRRKSAFFSSHEFVPFFVAQAMSIIQDEDFEARYGCDGRMVPSSQICDYLHRPSSLSGLSMLEFIVSFERVQVRVQGQEGDYEKFSEDRLTFKDRHPLHKTHSLRRRRFTVVPELVGPRIPNKEELEQEDVKEKYALIALLLTFPFENVQQLKNNEGKFWPTFTDFRDTEKLTDSRRRYLEHLQEYYVSKKEAERERSVLMQELGEYEKEENWEELAERSHEMQEAFEGDVVIDECIPPCDAIAKSCMQMSTAQSIHLIDGKIEDACTGINGKVHIRGGLNEIALKTWPGTESYQNAPDMNEEIYRSELNSLREQVSAKNRIKDLPSDSCNKSPVHSFQETSQSWKQSDEAVTTVEALQEAMLKEGK